MKTYLIIFFTLCLGISSFAQSSHTLLRSGDSAYDKDDYQAAELGYRKSLEDKNSTKGAYNLANSIYQQERFDEAIRHYTTAAESAKDNTVKSNAYHNLGNALYAKQDFEESVNAYKNALRVDPKDVETKFNLGQAQRQLQIQQQQQQQQQNSDSKEGEEEPDDQEQQQEGEEQQDQQPQDQPQPVGDDQKEQDQQPQPKDLSKEEAQQLLEIMDEEERKVQEKVKKKQSKPSKSSKDW